MDTRSIFHFKIRPSRVLQVSPLATQQLFDAVCGVWLHPQKRAAVCKRVGVSIFTAFAAQRYAENGYMKVFLWYGVHKAENCLVDSILLRRSFDRILRPDWQQNRAEHNHGKSSEM